MEQITEQLKSSDISTQLIGLDKAQEAINELAKDVVQSFIHSRDPYTIISRIFHIGPVVIPELEKVLFFDNKELQVLAAGTLLKLGCYKGVPILIRELEKLNDYSCMIVGLLGTYKISEAKEGLLHLLSITQLKEVDLIVAILNSLDQLNIPVPLHYDEVFLKADIDWQISTVYLQVTNNYYRNNS